MMKNKSYKIKLYPSDKQIILIDKTIHACRFIYNQTLNEKITIYEKLKNNKELLYSYKYKTEKQYKEEFDFLNEVSSRALQQSRRDLNDAFNNFYNGLKKGKFIGFPKFKSKKNCKWSYREPQVGKAIEIKNNKIKLLKLGWVKFKGLSKDFNGIIKSVTIENEQNGNYTASILVENDDMKIRENDDTIGIDFGLNSFATMSNGEQIDLPKDYLSKEEAKLKKIQKQFSRQTKGSNRRELTRIKINRLYKHIKHIKDHFYWHLANRICKHNETIVIEDLNIKGMQKSNLSSSIQRVGWSNFVNKLSQKAIEYGSQIIKANRWFPSSKLCSCCGQIKEELSLSDRVYECECGLKIDRDLNASFNLKKVAHELGETINVHRETVRLTKLQFNLASSFIEV
jgi:putative transposase